jgi:hypothetical protein
MKGEKDLIAVGNGKKDEFFQGDKSKGIFGSGFICLFIFLFIVIMYIY